MIKTSLLFKVAASTETTAQRLSFRCSVQRKSDNQMFLLPCSILADLINLKRIGFEESDFEFVEYPSDKDGNSRAASFSEKVANIKGCSAFEILVAIRKLVSTEIEDRQIIPEGFSFETGDLAFAETAGYKTSAYEKAAFLTTNIGWNSDIIRDYFFQRTRQKDSVSSWKDSNMVTIGFLVRKESKVPELTLARANDFLLEKLQDDFYLPMWVEHQVDFDSLPPLSKKRPVIKVGNPSLSSVSTVGTLVPAFSSSLNSFMEHELAQTIGGFAYPIAQYCNTALQIEDGLALEIADVFTHYRIAYMLIVKDTQLYNDLYTLLGFGTSIDRLPEFKLDYDDELLLESYGHTLFENHLTGIENMLSSLGIPAERAFMLNSGTGEVLPLQQMVDKFSNHEAPVPEWVQAMMDDEN